MNRTTIVLGGCTVGQGVIESVYMMCIVMHQYRNRDCIWQLCVCRQVCCMKEEVTSAMMAAETPSPYAKTSSRAPPPPSPSTQRPGSFKYKFDSHRPHPTKGAHVSLFDGLSFETPDPAPPPNPASASTSNTPQEASTIPTEASQAPSGVSRYMSATRPARHVRSDSSYQGSNATP